MDEDAAMPSVEPVAADKAHVLSGHAEGRAP